MGERQGREENPLLRTRTHLRGDAELRRQVEEQGGNVLDHLHHHVFAEREKGGGAKVDRSATILKAKNVPVGQVVPLEDEGQRGAEFRIHSYGAPELGASEMPPGLHLHQHTDVSAGEHLGGAPLGASVLTCKAGLACACSVCFSVSLASVDPP